MAYQKMTKAEKNKKHKEAIENKKIYNANYHKIKHKYITIAFDADNEEEMNALDYLNKQESRNKFIKDLILDKLKREQ